MITELHSKQITALMEQSSPIDLIELSYLSRECLSNEYHMLLADTKYCLQQGDLDTRCKHPENTEHLKRIQSIVSRYPKIVSFVSSKPLVPQFDEIPEQPDDDKDIKKVIRRANYDFIGYSCNHKQFDKQYSLVQSKVAEIYESKEYKEYDKRMDNIARLVCHIQDTDQRRDKVWSGDSIDDIERGAKEMVDIIILINKKILAVNAGVNLECHRCKGVVKKYDYCKRLIDTMRNEVIDRDNKMHALIAASSRSSDDGVDDPKQSFGQWMCERFGSLERIPLSDIKKAYKSSFNKTITMDVLSNMLSDTKIYRVTASHNKYYANKLSGV